MLITVVLVLILAGFCLWLVNQLIPMEPKYKTALNGVVALGVCLWIVGLLLGHPILPMR